MSRYRNLTDLPLLIPVETMAELLNKSEAAVRLDCRKGRVPAVKVGRRWFILRDRFFSAGDPSSGTCT